MATPTDGSRSANTQLPIVAGVASEPPWDPGPWNRPKERWKLTFIRLFAATIIIIHPSGATLAPTRAAGHHARRDITHVNLQFTTSKTSPTPSAIAPQSPRSSGAASLCHHLTDAVDCKSTTISPSEKGTSKTSPQPRSIAPTLRPLRRRAPSPRGHVLDSAAAGGTSAGTFATISPKSTSTLPNTSQLHNALASTFAGIRSPLLSSLEPGTIDLRSFLLTPPIFRGRTIDTSCARWAHPRPVLDDTTGDTLLGPARRFGCCFHGSSRHLFLFGSVSPPSLPPTPSGTSSAHFGSNGGSIAPILPIQHGPTLRTPSTMLLHHSIGWNDPYIAFGDERSPLFPGQAGALRFARPGPQAINPPPWPTEMTISTRSRHLQRHLQNFGEQSSGMSQQGPSTLRLAARPEERNSHPTASAGQQHAHPAPSSGGIASPRRAEPSHRTVGAILNLFHSQKHMQSTEKEQLTRAHHGGGRVANAGLCSLPGWTSSYGHMASVPSPPGCCLTHFLCNTGPSITSHSSYLPHPTSMAHATSHGGLTSRTTSFQYPCTDWVSYICCCRSKVAGRTNASRLAYPRAHWPFSAHRESPTHGSGDQGLVCQV